MNEIRCFKCGRVINTGSWYYVSFYGSFCKKCWSKQSESFKSEKLTKALLKRFKCNINK